MGDGLQTDRLLGELFTENAPHVNETLFCERVAQGGLRRRRGRRRARAVRIAAVAFACVVLAAGVAYAGYRVVTLFRESPVLVLTDSTVSSTNQPGSTGSPDLSKLSPEAQAMVKTMTSAPLELTAGEDSWAITPEEVARCLDYVPTSAVGASALEPRLSAEKLGAFFAQIAAGVEIPPADATFVVSGSDHLLIVPSQEGKAIDAEKTAQALTAAALRTTRRTAEVVLVAKAPRLTTADAQAMGIEDLLATYTTVYEGTAARRSMVRLATKHASDVILAPGEEYDFTAQVGPFTPENGYNAVSGVVSPGGLVDVFDGALTQVSTTLFNAAFEAGLKITERHNASLYIAHYPEGRDAAIDSDGKNLRFVNDTAHYLLVHGESDGVTTWFSIFGTKDGRKVTTTFSGFHYLLAPTEVTTPVSDLPAGTSRVVSPGQSGRRCEVVRTITHADGSTTSDTFMSVWQMVPRQIDVGAGATEGS